MTPPLLLTPRLEDKPGLLRQRAAEQFGALAPCLASGEIPGPPSDPATAGQWRRLVAEEILLARLCALPLHPRWLDAFKDIAPFAGQRETLEELLHTARWVAVIPIARPHCKTGTLIRLWGLSEESPPENRVEDAGSPIRLGGWEDPIAGRSWQLGASLARRIRKNQRADLQLQLAQQWIVTGAIHGAEVGPVGKDNKMAINTRRRWLVPAACTAEFSSEKHHVHPCSDLDGAWTQFSGEGTLGEEPADYPPPGTVSALHVNVSKAVAPLICSILLVRPRHLILWHSPDEQESGRFARLIADFLNLPRVRAWQGWAGRPPEISLRELPDANLVEAERVLRDAGLDRATPGSIFYNITGGTKIMMLAAHSMARLNPNIRLIYREFDPKENPTSLITISNSSGIPRTNRMTHPDPPRGIKWDFIHLRTEQNESPATLAEKILALPDKNTGNGFRGGENPEKEE